MNEQQINILQNAIKHCGMMDYTILEAMLNKILQIEREKTTDTSVYIQENEMGKD